MIDFPESRTVLRLAGVESRHGAMQCYDVIRVFLGLLLLLAAGLKGYQLAKGPVPETGIVEPRCC
jgi:hypothetical protein